MAFRGKARGTRAAGGPTRAPGPPGARLLAPAPPPPPGPAAPEPPAHPPRPARALQAIRGIDPSRPARAVAVEDQPGFERRLARVVGDTTLFERRLDAAAPELAQLLHDLGLGQIGVGGEERRRGLHRGVAQVE